MESRIPFKNACMTRGEFFGSRKNITGSPLKQEKPRTLHFQTRGLKMNRIVILTTSGNSFLVFAKKVSNLYFKSCLNY